MTDGKCTFVNRQRDYASARRKIFRRSVFYASPRRCCCVVCTCLFVPRALKSGRREWRREMLDEKFSTGWRERASARVGLIPSSRLQARQSQSIIPGWGARAWTKFSRRYELRCWSMENFWLKGLVMESCNLMGLITFTRYLLRNRFNENVRVQDYY